jgi:ABC-type bacteriocin/lantibiotic exporter with double-glycine peptidase domain
MRNVLTETHQLVQNGLMPVISLVADCLLLLCIVGLLVFAEPLGALATASTLGIAALLFYGGFRNLVYKWGQERQHHEGLRIQNLQQGLNGTKDVKLLGRERQFLDKFRFHDHATAKAVRNQSVLSQMPRLGLEFLAVLGLVVLVVTMLLQGRQLDSVLPTLGLFAVAAFRMMPSVNKLIGSLQQLKFATPVIDNVHKDLHLKTESIAEDQDSSDSDAIELTRTIALENVSFAYDSAQQPALSEVFLDIARGESVGLIGESGSGKSTLVDVILGVLVPAIGNVCVDGVNIHSNVRSWQRRIGYVPQTIFLTDESLRCNIAFGLHEYEIDDEAVARAVRAAQLEDFVETLPEGFETVVGERGVRLSGGQRQRIGIARALYHDPDVLVLDEATSALDTETELEVMKAVNALHGDKTIVIIAHRLTTVSRCDRIYRLHGGRIIKQGRPEQVLGENFNSDVENGAPTPTDDVLSSKTQSMMPAAGSGL